MLVVGKDEDLKTKMIEVKKANNVSIIDLAKGGPGRLVIYTENAIKLLEEKIK